MTSPVSPASSNPSSETTSPAPSIAPSENLPVIDFKDSSAYSAVIGLGYGTRDLGNEQGMDHGGAYFKASAGINLRFLKDKFKLTPRLFYENQSLSKDLGEGISSKASVNAFGVEADAGYTIHRYFSVHGLLGLGAAVYSSSDTTDGLHGGAEFNKNALKAPLSGTAIRIQPGLAVCTLGASVCLNGSYAIDSGVNPTIEVIDGGPYPPMGLNPTGFTMGASVDGIGLYNFFAGKRGKPVVKDPVPPPATAKEEAAKPATPVVVAPVKLQGMDLVKSLEHQVFEAKVTLELAVMAVKENTDQFKKTRENDRKKTLASESISKYRSAFKANDDLDRALAEMELTIPSLFGPEKKKAELTLSILKTRVAGIKAKIISAREQTNGMVKAHNAGKKGAELLDFPDGLK